MYWIYVGLTFCVPDQYNRYRIKITFSSFSSRKLKVFEQNCVSRENLDHFNEEYFEFCFSDCYSKRKIKPMVVLITSMLTSLLIKTSEGMAINSVSLRLNKAQYFSTEIIQICETKCKSKCEDSYYDHKFEVSKHISNETILEFTPKNFLVLHISRLLRQIWIV